MTVKGLSQQEILEKLKDRPWLTVDFSTYQGTKKKARFVDSEYGEFWARPANVFFNGMNHKDRGARIRAQKISKHPQDADTVENLIRKTKPWLSLDKGTFKNFRDQCRWVDELFGEFFNSPYEVEIRGTQHKFRVQYQFLLKFLEAKPYIKIDLSTYRGNKKKCWFVDEAYGRYKILPSTLYKGGGDHPDKVKKTGKSLDTEILYERIKNRGLKLVEDKEKELIVECKNGHIFLIKKINFLRKETEKRKGYFCPACGNQQTYTQKEIEEKYAVFGFKVLGQYKNAHEPFLAECSKGHQLPSTMQAFISVGGHPPCRLCKHEEMRVHSAQSIQEYLNKTGYKLLTEVVTRVDQSILVKCDKGHRYETGFNQIFYSGQLCPKCGVTQLEKQVHELLDALGVEYFVHDRKQIPPYEIDILTGKIAIEMAGLYWHSEKIESRKKDYHSKKLKMCNEKGLSLLTIYDDEWNFKRPIVESIIRNKLGLISRKISARQCEVKPVDFKTSSKFFKENHLMGFTTHRSFGLFFKKELVSLLSYKQKKNNREIEIIRFCSLLNTSVRGSFGKLLSEIKKLDSDFISSWVDLRYGNGSSYLKLGFEHKKTTLGWKWTNFKKTFNRLQVRANMDGRKLSQEEHAKELKVVKIYDCGQAFYVLPKKNNL